MKKIQILGSGCPKCVMKGVTTSILTCVTVLMGLTSAWGSNGAASERARHTDNVCPPFPLRAEDGSIINPHTGANVDKPYSPKQTCGRCHDYERITKAYHFMQGKGEKPTADQAKRVHWASTPGNYGGTWCSPAPLYPYLSPKHNNDAGTMDMTSFTFISIGCGECHPGGGSAEYDREGKRYDRWVIDPKSGFKPGGENNFDGDYYKALWSKTGVLEADCLICHLPEYDMAERRKQIKLLNWRWAATAGSGFAKVTGSVKDGAAVRVEYNKALFNPDGSVEPHIVREPRNQACLACHAKPGWKKRGANFRPRTDVHLRAGLKCVDCHAAGSFAVAPSIRGRELHEIGKGDDPGGHVRDELDNTCRTCESCHDTGEFGAPVPKHNGLPPIHLEKIACQTCHIPWRFVKSAQVVASDIFNPGTKIPTKGKHLWTFYGPDAKYWNHYGELEMEGYDDKPTDPFRPGYFRYKDKIYPGNRVHTTWPAIEVEGKPGLTEPRMKDIYGMWEAHQSDPKKYPRLSKITDDNGDGIIEVNRPEEIDALIAGVTQRLKDVGYPMKGKRVVWVCNDRVYSSGTKFRTIPKHPWEASPYGNVHKYTHDVLPSRAALGRNGCTDCHSSRGPMFLRQVLKRPFDEQAKPVFEPQYAVLGLSELQVRLGILREQYLKPTLYGALVSLVCLLTGWVAVRVLVLAWPAAPPRSASVFGWVVALATLCGAAFLLFVRPELVPYMLPTRRALDGNHFALAVALLMAGAAGLVYGMRTAEPAQSFLAQIRAAKCGIAIVFSALLTCAAGFVMLVRQDWMGAVGYLAYSVFDLGLLFLVLSLICLLLRTLSRPNAESMEKHEAP